MTTTTPTTAGATATPAALTSALTPLLPALRALESHLNTAFIEREGAIRAILVALLARQHAVLIGLCAAHHQSADRAAAEAEQRNLQGCASEASRFHVFKSVASLFDACARNRPRAMRKPHRRLQ